MPAYFPQLRPGSAMQYPLRKAVSYRTVMHPTDEVTHIRSADDGAAQTHWDLQLRGLSDEELTAVTSFFREMRGRHGSFVFLDPEGNLIAESENAASALWSKTAGITVSPAPSAPPPAQSAWHIGTSGSPGELWQSLPLPTNYHWLLSVYARADTPTQMALFVRSSYGEQLHQVTANPTWRRYWFGGMWWPTGEGIDAGVRLISGGEIDLTGFQLETQSAPASYKKTGPVSGVIPDARFLDDHLRVTTLAMNCHQMNVRVGAPLRG